jgi:hypothetical protein
VSAAWVCVERLAGDGKQQYRGVGHGIPRAANEGAHADNVRGHLKRAPIGQRPLPCKPGLAKAAGASRTPATSRRNGERKNPTTVCVAMDGKAPAQAESRQRLRGAGDREDEEAEARRCTTHPTQTPISERWAPCARSRGLWSAGLCPSPPSQASSLWRGGGGAHAWRRTRNMRCTAYLSWDWNRCCHRLSPSRGQSAPQPHQRRPFFRSCAGRPRCLCV